MPGLSLIVFVADCIQTSYKVPAIEKELPSAAVNIHGTTELVVELVRRMSRKDSSVPRRAALATSSCRSRAATRLSKEVKKSMRLPRSKYWLWMSHSLHSRYGGMTKNSYESSGPRTTFWSANHAQGHHLNHSRLHHWRRPCYTGSLEYADAGLRVGEWERTELRHRLSRDFVMHGSLCLFDVILFIFY